MLKRLNTELVGHLCFIILIVLSVIHYQERIINYDSAWYAFRMSNYGGILYGRPIAVISQLLPWLLLKLGVSLKVFLISFSVSFSLIYYLIFLLITRKFKDQYGGLLLALTLLVCVRETYFNPVTEVFIGCALGVLFFVVSKQLYKKSYYWVSSILVLLCYFSHPITFFLIAFSCFYLWFEKIENRKKLLIPFILVGVIYSVKLLFFSDAGPESSEFSNAKNFIRHLPNFFNLQPTEQIILHSGDLSNKYLLWTIMFFTGIIVLLAKKKWIQSILVLFFVFSFLAITNSIYYKGESALVLEKSILPLAFFVSVPIVYELVPFFKNRSWIVFATFSLVFFLKYRDIGMTAKRFKKKNSYYTTLSNYSKSKGKTKFVISRELFDKTNIKIPWAVPIESLLVSSVNGQSISLSVEHICVGEKQFFGPTFVGCMSISSLNQDYYKLNEERYLEIDESILFE